jgi:membrane protein implicated in regulation of membrane protease activity
MKEIPLKALNRITAAVLVVVAFVSAAVAALFFHVAVLLRNAGHGTGIGWAIGGIALVALSGLSLWAAAQFAPFMRARKLRREERRCMKALGLHLSQYDSPRRTRFQ